MLSHQFKLNFLLGSYSNNLHYLQQLLDHHQPMVVLPCSLNDLAYQEQAAWQTAYQAVDICTTDGMPLVYYFRKQQKRGQLALKGQIERTYGPDLMQNLLKKDRTHRHFFAGSSQKTIKLLSKHLKKHYPPLLIAGSWSPPLADAETISQLLIKKLKKQPVDILWLGLSSPKQVKVAQLIKQQLTNNKNSKLKANLKIFCVGAAFDFITGSKKQAPLTWRQAGLEWLYRLLQEPQRLAKRYLWDIPIFIVKKLLF